MGNLGRQRLILFMWLCLLPVLINLNKLLKLTQTQDEDHNNIDINHPSSPFFSDYAANDKRSQLLTSNPSSLTALSNDTLILKCTSRDRKTKTINVTDVSLEDFYAENSKCMHSFKEDTVAFHVGKGGGGTLMKHLGIGVNWVHPRPKQSVNEQLQNGQLRTLIFNVRDPVDRFVSAFNWRSLILCNPNGDTRHKGKETIRGKKKVGATKRPDEYCKPGYDEEERLLRETYESRPQLLAEALCDDSPLRLSAEQDATKIHHSTTLTQWLDFLIDPSLVKNIGDDGIQQFIVLPVEKLPGANETLFEKHIENVRYHLLSNRYGEDASSNLMRLAEEQKRKKEEKLSQKRKDMQKHEAHLHSSAKHVNSTKTKLTKMGECCLARYLKDDYQLIRTMLGGEEAIAVLDPLVAAHPVIQKACSWGNEQHQELCRGDLESMLMRRAKYLDESKGSCSAIVPAEM